MKNKYIKPVIEIQELEEDCCKGLINSVTMDPGEVLSKGNNDFFDDEYEDDDYLASDDYTWGVNWD